MGVTRFFKSDKTSIRSQISWDKWPQCSVYVYMLVCLNRCTVFLSVCIDTTGPLSSRELFWFSGWRTGCAGRAGHWPETEDFDGWVDARASWTELTGMRQGVETGDTRCLFSHWEKKTQVIAVSPRRAHSYFIMSYISISAWGENPEPAVLRWDTHK